MGSPLSSERFRTPPPPPRTSALPPECACLVLTSAGSSGSCPCPLQSGRTTAQTEDPVKNGHILSLLCPKPSTDGHLRVKPTSSGGQQLEWPMLANPSTGHPVKLNFRERSICMRRVQKISHHLSEIRVPYSPNSQTHEASGGVGPVRPASTHTALPPPAALVPWLLPPWGQCTHVSLTGASHIT